ncbi:MAG: ABC transporter permease [FCB group bacterium]|nr:ABC transporter permease [FCB group bacterium]
MNFWKFIWKFTTRKGISSRTSWSVFLPVGGVFLGTLVVTLTFAIMDGMESDIYGKLRDFSSAAVIDLGNSTTGEQAELANFLTENQITFYRAIDRNGVLVKDDLFRLVQIRAVDDFPNYVMSHLKIAAVDTMADVIILGSGLADRLGASRASGLDLVSPLDISLTTGIPPRKKLYIADIFESGLVDFDLNSAVIPLQTGRAVFHHSSSEKFLLDTEFTQDVAEQFHSDFGTFQYSTWEDEYSELLSAMRLEKIAYSIFGFMIVFISGFNLLSVMSMSVMRKIARIGILKTLGFTRQRIAWIFFTQALITGLCGALLGTLSAWAAVQAERHFHLLKSFMSTFPLAEFPLILQPGKILLVIGISLILTIVAGIYPARKAASLHPVKAIDYVR